MVLRFGQGRAAQRYGLAVQERLQWIADTQPGHYRACIEIADLQAEEMLVPSLVLLCAKNYGYRWSLTVAEHKWWLAGVNSHADNADVDTAPQINPNSSITTHIDFFAAEQAAQHPLLTVHVRTDSTPSDYLLVISRRRKNIDISGMAPRRPLHPVPAISQMMQPSAQRHRTCSPTALSMLMAYYRAPYYPSVVDACRDPQTGLYGVWPLNIVQAGLRGFTGAVELVSDWTALESYDSPFIASISFAKGELDGAPLEQTGGHLVVVCGTTSDRVLCNDPAAPTASTVARSYDLEQFSKAWLSSRGAAYLLQPAHDLQPAETG